MRALSVPEVSGWYHPSKRMDQAPNRELKVTA